MRTSTCLDSETLAFDLVDYSTLDSNLEPNGRDSMAADVFVAAAIKRKPKRQMYKENSQEKKMEKIAKANFSSQKMSWFIPEWSY